MLYLLLRLEAPLQSWGLHGRFSSKDTYRSPTKSGVVGLIANAMGRDRTDPIDDIAQCTMAVRIDREPRIETDFQTAGSGNAEPLLSLHGREKIGYFAPKSESDTAKGSNPIVMRRHYLADGSFVVALGGPPDTLTAAATAVQAPARPLYLGRRGFIPTRPIFEGLVEAADLLDALHQAPHHGTGETQRIRCVLEETSQEKADDTIPDIPTSFAPNRRAYRLRHVRTVYISLPAVS